MRHRETSRDLLPFDLVKYFAFTSLVLMMLASLLLSWMIAANARSVLLERSEAYSRLFADNLNSQVVQWFVLPVVVRFSRIQLSDERQYEWLDRIVRTLIRDMPIQTVTIYELDQDRVAYSTRTELKGSDGLGGLEYQKAIKGEASTVLITGGSLFSLLPGADEIYCSQKTYVPFRMRRHQGDIVGVIEVVQDLSEDLKAVIRLQGKVIVLSLSVMAVLFLVLSLIVVRANRIMTRRAEERLRLEEQLNQAQRLAVLGKMVAAVSHEIKNPLGIVRSTAEMLGKRITRVAPGNEHLANIIVDETSRLDGIVREFLDFANPRETKMAARSLNAILERVLRFMEPELQKRLITIQTELSRELPNVLMDGEQMYQVIFNIVFNAVQSIPAEGGEITIRSSLNRDHSAVELRISDTGVGIEADKLDQIFTPFYTDKSRGTGLGLSIANNIVEKHRGSIVVSSAPGEGSVFSIILPV